MSRGGPKGVQSLHTSGGWNAGHTNSRSRSGRIGRPSNAAYRQALQPKSPDRSMSRGFVGASMPACESQQSAHFAYRFAQLPPLTVAASLTTSFAFRIRMSGFWSGCIWRLSQCHQLGVASRSGPLCYRHTHAGNVVNSTIMHIHCEQSRIVAV